MRLSNLLIRIGWVVLPIAAVCHLYLYQYPRWHRCGFPAPADAPATVPFRLLALGDPQLEGSTSLPDPTQPVFPALRALAGDLAEIFHSLNGTYAHSEPATDVPYALASALDHLRTAARRDLVRWLRGLRKRVDLWGNDRYLAHIFRTMRASTQPTHVVVLGDLLGSQWIDDAEFGRRRDRFWGTVFRGGERVVVPGEATSTDDPLDSGEGESEGEGVAEAKTPWVEELGADPAWTRRIICIAGNHDVGYAGDINEHRMARFEAAFGAANWEVRFQLHRNRTDGDNDDTMSPPPPELRLVILNSMNLDTPAYSAALQGETYDFLNQAIGRGRPVEDPTAATILLTHVPLYKPRGVCVDPPYFTYFDNADGPGGIREQNHLSATHSRGILLEGIFGIGRGGSGNGVILNGHDHEGCDTWHRILSPAEQIEWAAQDELAKQKQAEAAQAVDQSNQAFEPQSPPPAGSSEPPETADETTVRDEDEEEQPDAEEPPQEEELQDHNLVVPPDHFGRWESVSYTSALEHGLPAVVGSPGLREVTVRSMMGDFAGNAGLLSAWFDSAAQRWRFEYATCSSGVQHVWWAVHVVDLIAVLVVVGAVLAKSVELTLQFQLEGLHQPLPPGVVQRNPGHEAGKRVDGPPGVLKASGMSVGGTARERRPP